MNNFFDFKWVPKGWALCFNNDCPRRGECLRHVAGEHVPQGVSSWRCLLPQAATGATCQAFCPLAQERHAYGLGQLFDHVEKKDYAALKSAVTTYLGGRSNYYRYHRGERLLSPAQQEHIAQLLAKAGYAAGPVFGGYQTVVPFPLTVFDRDADA
ncbi:MAG: hypothetical protein IJ841_05675 [Prevotella sp.]|nr:hypothetical protein [Prevotella sp.]